MGSIPPELSLDVRPSFVPKTINEFLGELAAVGSVSEKKLRIDDFVKRLEEELKKIDAFKRELPLCMILLTDAIGTLKEQSTQCRSRFVEPILEEFIPLKKSRDQDEKSEVKREKDKEKMNWMSSVQLWNTDECKDVDSKCDQKQNSVAKFMKGAVDECPLAFDNPFKSNKNGNGSKPFMPFKDYSIFPATLARKEDKVDLPVAGLSLLTPGTKNPRDEIGSNGLSSKIIGSSTTPIVNSNLRARSQTAQLQAGRKHRRCWSPELHRRFVSALQQLGGSQVATPKQIRELMQVDGLTNDEVKSHLQKYRLHTRKHPTVGTHSMVVLGSLWMPQDESSKPCSSQSGSPQGPLQLVATGTGTSTTGGESMEEEEEVEVEDDKSESYSWKSHMKHKSGKEVCV